MCREWGRCQGLEIGANGIGMGTERGTESAGKGTKRGLKCFRSLTQRNAG
jgi:hypothetical protein